MPQSTFVVIVVQVLGFMFTLSVLALSKQYFTLSTVMWFALMPLIGLFAHGVRTMRLILVVALCFGTACFVLLQNNITLGGFPDDPSIQHYIDYIAWVVFMLLAAGVGRVFAQTQKEEETRRVEVELILERSKRMRAIGELAGGVAHEFNNLLAVIGGTAGLLREELTDEPMVVEGLTDIERAVTRGSEISGELLAFARGQESRK